VSETTPSGTVASPGSGEPRADSAAAPPPSARITLTPATVVIAAATLLALGLRFYQLSRPGYLLGVNEYDDGNYFGSAVRLVSGALPYRDFLIVQPPGITLLMVPAALLSKVTGTAWGMAVGRILTVLVGSASVTLVGLLVRHRGVLATVIACGICAVYPASIQAAKTVLVEPWLVLFCLIGALALFERDQLTRSGRRIFWGGVAFGFGGAVEPWAIFPVIVVAALLILPPSRPFPAAPARRPWRLARYAAGVAAGFGVPVVPFAALAPGKFYEATIIAQIGGRASATRVAIWPRLQFMTGLADLSHPTRLIDTVAAILIVGFVLGGMALGILLTRRVPPALDLFAVGSAAIVVAAFLWPTQFHYHFGAFLAPFLGMAIGLTAARLLPDPGPGPEPAAGGTWTMPVAMRWGAAGVAALAILIMAGYQYGWERGQVAKLPLSVTNRAQRLIPPGACLLADEMSFAVMTNRLTSDVPGCSLLLDATGTNYALSHGRDPETGAARYANLDAVWTYAFDHAQYVWLTGLNKHRVAWTPQLTSYFNSHFVRVMRAGPAGSLYRRIGLNPPG
jgi:alpha-1,2-mannosyltransferase